MTQFNQFRETLAASGFHLCDVMALSALPDDIWLSQPNLSEGYLLLVAHAGPDFWQAYTKSGITGDDPVDHFSARMTEQALAQFFPDIQRELLFPRDDCPMNLMALGRAFGWHHASPLGMGINETYGLWSAYRAVWWLDSEPLSPQTPLVGAPDICSGCETQDCIKTCPADALTLGAMPNLGNCVDYRLSDKSDCVSGCVARLACPYASQYRYKEAQIAYHYDLAISGIAAYRSDPGEG